MSFLARHAQWIANVVALASGLALSVCSSFASLLLATGDGVLPCARSIMELGLDLPIALLIGAGFYGIVVYEFTAMIFESRGVAKIKRAEMAASLNDQKYPLITRRERFGLCAFFAVALFCMFYTVALRLDVPSLCVDDLAPVAASQSTGE